MAHRTAHSSKHSEVLARISGGDIDTSRDFAAVENLLPGDINNQATKAHVAIAHAHQSPRFIAPNYIGPKGERVKKRNQEHSPAEAQMRAKKNARYRHKVVEKAKEWPLQQYNKYAALERDATAFFYSRQLGFLGSLD